MTSVPHNPLESPEKPELVLDLNETGLDDQISIVIVHRNKPEHLNICLQSIRLMSNLNNYEIIVVDNASDQESQEYLDLVADGGVKVVRLDQNCYWSKACNKGVEVADKSSKYLIFLHCDTVVLNPAWIDILVNVAQAREAGLLGLEFQSYYVQNQKVDFVQEWCMLLSNHCWNDIGPWPEELPLVGHSFIMTVRAQYRGHKPQIIKNNVVHHYKSFSADPNDYERLAEEAMSVVPKLMRVAQST